MVTNRPQTYKKIFSISCNEKVTRVLFAAPWTVASQAPLSMEFSRQEYWSGLPFAFSRRYFRPRDQTQVPCIAGGFFTNVDTREAAVSYC